MKRIIVFLFILISVSGLCAASAVEERSQSNKMPLRMNEMQTKFDALSIEQRSEVYKLTDELTEKLIELAEKYCEFGVITNEEKVKLIEMLKTGNEAAKKDGKVIFAMPPVKRMEKSR